MITWFLSLLLITAASPDVHAKGACEFFAGKSPVQETIARFKELGFHNLLEEYNQGKIEVSLRKRHFNWQSTVRARVSLTGTKNLIVRDNEFKTDTEKQKFEWQLALALFKLKMHGKFISEIQDIENPTLAEFAIGFRMPKAWRDDKLNKAEETLKELYYLFMLLDKLDARTLLPTHDIKKPIRALFLRDGSRALVPNQVDFELLVSEGEEKFGQALTERHKRSFLFSYYVNHLRRILGYATTFTTVAALTPVIQEMPELIESSETLSEFLINLQIELFYYLVP